MHSLKGETRKEETRMKRRKVKVEEKAVVCSRLDSLELAV
jgi:hypothetical protein